MTSQISHVYYLYYMIVTNITRTISLSILHVYCIYYTISSRILQVHQKVFFKRKKMDMSDTFYTFPNENNKREA